MTELWTFGSSAPGTVAERARRAEDEGWDGIVVVDSQNLRLDCYVVMAIAATVTKRLKVSPGVTNPYTRHAAVAAGAVASIHTESGGRASWGVGRGDSALAHLGLAPAPLDQFERYVADVQAYLRGEPVPFRQADDSVAGAESLHLHDRPTASTMKWIDATWEKPIVEVVATGPKVIGIGGRHADMVTFTVGADLDRLRWGIATAKQAAVDAGRSTPIQLGAYINVTCHPDRVLARRLVAGGLASFSRFSSMHGTTTGPVGEQMGKVLKDIQTNYDMTRHGRADTTQTSVMTDEFIDQFAVAGPANYCAERIEEILSLGIDRLVVTTPNQGICDQYPVETADAQTHLVNELLPRMRA